MREILFRGKRVDNGEWVEGCLLSFDSVIGTKSYIIPQDEMCSWISKSASHTVEVDPNTVGQYIGVKDKFGKKVFEDDIIEETYICATNGRYAVSYDESSFTYINPKGWEDVIDDNEYGINIGLCKVIGNIHDNPELMEEKHNG